jgi:hypothetical protein
MHGKRCFIEFGLGRRFVIEMVEAVGAPNQGRRQPGRPDLAQACRDIADADADAPVVAPVRAGAVRGQRVMQ